MKITIIETGIANTASIVAAFSRLGVESEFAESRNHVLSADAVVLPGVGAFDAGVAALREQGMLEALKQRVSHDAPTLAVCLGFQLLCEQSEESHDPQGTAGLSVIPRKAVKFGDSLRVPQLGWNWVEADPECSILNSGYAYFANSYRIAERIDSPWRCCMAEYGGSFVAAAERGRILGCQFHPELSGVFGANILRKWLEKGRSA